MCRLARRGLNDGLSFLMAFLAALIFSGLRMPEFAYATPRCFPFLGFFFPL